MVLQTKPEILIDPHDPMGSVLNAIADGLDPDSDLPPEEAEELNLARTRMRYFIPYTFPGYRADFFHLIVCDAIDRIVSLDLTHLMLFAPPQTGKSEILSTRLPGFWLAHHPDKPVLLSSYGDELAMRNSRNAMSVVESPAYERLFGSWGIRPDPARWRYKAWYLQGEKGGARSAGVGGRVVGEGFGLGIVDDPTKDWAEAQSEVIREKQWDWWQGTLISRFWEGHATVFMTTRWHEDGLEARVLNQEGNLNVCMECGKYLPDDKKPARCPKCGGPRGRWKTLSFPALSESQEDRDVANHSLGLPGGLPDPLGRTKVNKSVAPSRFSSEFYKDTETRVGSMVWSASYQQHPTPPKGDFYKVGKIEIVQSYPLTSFGGTVIEQTRTSDPSRVDYRPVGCHNCIRFWDLAATEAVGSGDPDWTIGGLVGIDKEDPTAGGGLTWVLDVQRARGAPENIVELMKTTAKLDGKRVKIRIEQEPGAAGKKLINDFKRILVGYDVEGIPSTGDKQTRARAFATQVNAGNVRIMDAEWNIPWMAVLRNFPHGKHDDDVDATSGAFNEITEPSGLHKIKFKSLKTNKRR